MATLLYTVKVTDRLLRFDTTNGNAVVTLLPFIQTPNAPYEIHKTSIGDGHTVTIQVDPTTHDFLLPGGATSIVLDDASPTVYIRIPASGLSPAYVNAGGGGGGGGGTGDATGPVTGFTTAHEIGTRYADPQTRQVHMTVGFTPTLPTPQNVTYLISQDDGANWSYAGFQRMQTAGQELKLDQLAPAADSSWMMAAVAGVPGGDPGLIADTNLDALYPGVVRSASFPVAGLSVPLATTGITATIGVCTNVVSADGFTQYGRIPGVVYTDPTGSLAFFVRITVQNLDSAHNPLTPEQAYGGTQITGGSHTEKDLLVTYIPGLAYIQYRFYVANRNSQGAGDFSDPTTNTLQQVEFNGSTTTADHYAVPIVIPAFPTSPGAAYNVTSVTASEVGPKYQDEKQGLHTVIGVTAVLDVDYSSPRTVTIWFDFGDGKIHWQGWYALTSAGEVTRIGDPSLGSDGTRLSGSIWVPANTAMGTWRVWCGAGNIDDGVDPSSYSHSSFTVQPVGACSPTGTTNAHFVANPATGNVIDYSKYDPGIWRWEFYELTWQPPTLNQEPNLWFVLITIQKGATISGTWTPAPDYEGRNDDPTGQVLGRFYDEIVQAPGIDPNAVAVMSKFGSQPATWVIPPAENADLSTNVYRDFRFRMYNVSRLGVDASGSGGAGTYTLQTIAFAGADHFDLTPQSPGAVLDVRAANPATIQLPLTGGNGLPLTVAAGEITTPYLGQASVTANQMAQDAITAANQALAAGSVVDPNIVSLGINKVTYGTSVFAGDVVLSRGVSLPVMVLRNTGITLFGQSDASTGVTGLTSHPYVQIQPAGVKLLTGAGSSILIDSATNSLNFYSKDADTTQPYISIAQGTAASGQGGLAMVNGACSMAVNSNAINFTDTANHNALTMNSAGLTVSSGSASPPTNKLVITAAAVQLQYNNVARVTLDLDPTHNAARTTLSDGGSNSLVLQSTGITISTSGGGETVIDSTGVRSLSGAQCVRNAGGIGVQLWASWSESTQAGDKTQPYIGLEASTGNVYIGSNAHLLTLSAGSMMFSITGQTPTTVITNTGITTGQAGSSPFTLTCTFYATAGSLAGYREEVVNGAVYKVALYNQ